MVINRVSRFTIRRNDREHTNIAWKRKMHFIAEWIKKIRRIGALLLFTARKKKKTRALNYTDKFNHQRMC